MNETTRRKPYSPRREKVAASDRSNPNRPVPSDDRSEPRGRSAGDAYSPRCSPRAPRAPLNDEQRSMTMNHLGLAECLAARAARSKPSARDEFESAALLALVEAVQAFDPSLNVGFASFAYDRIHGALADLQRDLFSQGRRGPVADLPRFQQFEPEFEERGRVVGVRAEQPVGAELETADEVEARLKRLPSLHAATVRHIYFDGRNLDEAAVLIGCSKSSISRIYNEAIAWLHHAGESMPGSRKAGTAPLNPRRQLQQAWAARSKDQPRAVFGVAV